MSKKETKTKTTNKGEATMSTKEREAKPLYHLYRVVGADGKEIEGAKVETLVLTRNSAKVIKTQADNPGITLGQVSIS